MPDRRQLDDKGRLDEIVIDPCAAAHLERMDDGEWFLNLTRPDGTSVVVWLQSKRAIEAATEERDG